MCCLLRPFQLLYLLLFLLNFQPNLSSSSSSSSITQLCSPEEAAALIQFKTSFSIDESSSWWCDYYSKISYPKTNSWKEGLDCCSWDGITCDNVNGQVIGLDLSCSWLYGSIASNSSLFHLRHLQKLNLAFNYFNLSKMSSKFGQFASLEYLNLSEAYFTGQVPSQVSHLSKLVSLDLSGNYIQTLDKHTLKGLVENLTKHIALENNKLSGDIKEFQYNSLEEISFGNNKLKGPIPSSISHLVNLTFVDLSNLIGIVEVDMFSKLQNLQVLDLSYNSLSLSSNGVSANYTLPNLQGLYLSSCNVSEFPQFLRGSESLKRLDLSNNRISGKIPKWMWDVGKDSLWNLNLSHNSLTDFEQIPWKEIEYLDLSSNFIHGDLSIPPSTTMGLYHVFRLFVIGDVLFLV
ncbi:hypothetical protein POUND7_006623 [Theobroma cacao]